MKQKFMKFVIFILIISMVLPTLPVTSVSANNAIIPASGAITLQPITPQQWAIAFKDGITDWGYFSRRLQLHIKAKIPGMEAEVLIPYGGWGNIGHGRADLVRTIGPARPYHLEMYIWEVKT